MPDFFAALGEYAFLRHALLAGALASVASGVVGTFVVTRRITVIAGSLAHTVLGGMGAAYWLRATYGWEWLHPLHGAVVSALLAAVIIGLVKSRGLEREDTAISALWAIGMAAGILFLFHTPGYKADLMTYLFGNLVMIDPQSLKLLVILDVVILGLTLLFYYPLLAVSFDEEYARLRGLPVARLYTLLLCLTALTVVTLIYVVGIVMVIALLTLPVSVAGKFSRRLWQMMILSAVLSGVFTTAGLGISYGSDLPTGATTILLAGAVYLAVHLGAGVWRRLGSRSAARAPR